MAWKTNVLVFAVYLLLSVALTYPLAWNFSDSVPGQYDVWQNVWNFWWVGKAVFDLGVNPYFTPYLFHPTGVGLVFHTLELGNSLPGAVMARIWNIAVAYNMLVLLSFVLAGYGMFLLAGYVTGDKKAGFAAGLIYAFSPYHFMEAGIGHLNLLSIQWMPFYVLYLMKTFREGGKANAAVMALSFFAVSSTCLQYMGFMGIFTITYLAFEWRNDKRGFAACVRRLIPPFVFSGVLVLPLVYPIIAATLAGGGISSPLSTSVYYSQDVAAFFSPNVLNPVFGGIGRRIGNYLGGESGYGGIYAPGYVILALILLYFNREHGAGRKAASLAKKIVDRFWIAAIIVVVAVAYTLVLSRITGLELIRMWAAVLSFALLLCAYLFVKSTRLDFWGASLLLFGLLSLGPLMHLFGYVTMPLPYILLYFIPGFRIFRVPARFDVLFMLSAAVISAKFLSGIRAKRRGAVVYLVCVLVMVEFFSAPLPLSKISVPEFYAKIGGDGGDYAIMDVPISPIRFTTGNTTWENGLPHYMLYQTAHGKRMVGGYVSYPTKNAVAYVEGNVFLHLMNDLEGEGNASYGVIADVGRRTLSENDIRYVVVHKDVIREPQLYKPATLNKTLDVVIEVTSARTPVYEDDAMAVYERGNGRE